MDRLLLISLDEAIKKISAHYTQAKTLSIIGFDQTENRCRIPRVPDRTAVLWEKEMGEGLARIAIIELYQTLLTDYSFLVESGFQMNGVCHLPSGRIEMQDSTWLSRVDFEPTKGLYLLKNTL